jgi:hypothetical protein
MQLVLPEDPWSVEKIKRLSSDLMMASANFKKYSEESREHGGTKTALSQAITERDQYRRIIEAQDLKLADIKKPKQLIVKSAQFGLEGSRLDDVTLRVQAEIRSNALDIPVSDTIFPDTFGVRMASIVVAPNRGFFLRVVYAFGDGADRVAVRGLGDRLVLPEPLSSSEEV